MSTEAPVTHRLLGRSGIRVGAIGLGCWAIGGPVTWRGDIRQPLGWGRVDDAQSVRAVHAALDLGLTLFDTADVYGAGHSERVLGQALKGRRQQAVIATKFGGGYDEDRQVMQPGMASGDFTAAGIRRACEASLRRLQTDHIDLYQLHVQLPLQEVPDVVDALESLVAAGLIRAYAWSTDDPQRALAFAAGAHCAAVQFEQNVLKDNAAMLQVCEQHQLGAVCRTVLAMGLLTGKYRADASFPADDIRHSGPDWLLYFRGGRPDAELLRQLDAIRDLLCSGGRSLAQGALAWLLARSPRAIPIPGFRDEQQVREHARALRLGPLPPGAMAQIDALLAR